MWKNSGEAMVAAMARWKDSGTADATRSSMGRTLGSEVQHSAQSP